MRMTVLRTKNRVVTSVKVQFIIMLSGGIVLRTQALKTMSHLMLWLCLFLPSTWSEAQADESPQPKPKVVLVGDSIRLGYADTVVKQLHGTAIVTGPKANGGDSSNVLKNLEAWVIQEQPDVVHFNCGIHDTKKNKATGEYQVSPEQYDANLRKIVQRLRQETKATILFATTTPILTDRAAKGRAKADYALSGESIEQYNIIALKVMKELDVPVNDLHALFADTEFRDRVMGSDGTHFNAEGSAKLGQTVAGFIQQHMPHAPVPAPAPQSSASEK